VIWTKLAMAAVVELSRDHRQRNHLADEYRKMAWAIVLYPLAVEK
jgi:hypothetical protein